MPTDDKGASAVLPVYHANSGELHQIEVPLDTPVSDLHSALVGADYHPPTAEGSVEFSPDFIQRAREAWKATNDGRNPYAESGFSVREDGSAGPIHTEAHLSAPGMAGPPHEKISYLSTDKEIAHVHPDGSSGPEPSAVDIEAAKKIKKPVLVVSRGGLYEVDPYTGKTFQVHKGTGWMGEKR
jgi:hypothetical protein